MVENTGGFVLQTAI